ncbi:MerR family transcriptional regulator [Companilactobacillus sp. DQM5]|uniref:MerR family transcriptional regulator n=1 Tax=Companilactobacillus sp. DQM5 TaxID=3463359 RepID=UPI00405962F7
MVLGENFVDLLTPAQAAEKLGVNVTTLRKYSLLVEKVTANDAFFARKNNKRRNYTQKNIEDLQQMLKLSQKDDMTLELAAERLFDGKVPDKDIEEAVVETMSSTEKKLNEKISKQAKELKHLKKQLKDIQQENYALIRALKNSQETPLFDYDMNVNEELIPKKQNKINTNEVESESKEDKYAEALARARKIRDQKKEQTTIIEDGQDLAQKPQKLRTLSSMQLNEKSNKKRWWQR